MSLLVKDNRRGGGRMDRSLFVGRLGGETASSETYVVNGKGGEKFYSNYLFHRRGERGSAVLGTLAKGRGRTVSGAPYFSRGSPRKEYNISAHSRGGEKEERRLPASQRKESEGGVFGLLRGGYDRRVRRARRLKNPLTARREEGKGEGQKDSTLERSEVHKAQTIRLSEKGEKKALSSLFTNWRKEGGNKEEGKLSRGGKGRKDW